MGVSEFRVELIKEQLVFSAAHFITFAGDICERIHGHNYGVKATVCGELDENRYVIDFIAFRDALASITRELDHHVLLPKDHPLIKVRSENNEVIASFREKRWVFPEEDCVILPVINTTAEEIAAWMASKVRDALKPAIKHPLKWIEVGIDENFGQWGTYRMAW